MPVEYETIKVTLGPTHQRNLRNAMGSMTPVTLKLSKKHLTSGSDSLVVTHTMKERIEKKTAQNLGTTLRMTKALLKANRAQMSGGNLASLIPLAMDVHSALKEANDATPGAQRIKNRLAYLKQLQGGGIQPTEDAGAELGALVAQGDPKAKALAEKLKKQQSGSGQDGSGWDEFWEGFKFGFTNPIEALELAGREIKEAISPTPKKLTAQQKMESDALIKSAQTSAQNALKNAQRAQKGSGITFY